MPSRVHLTLEQKNKIIEKYGLTDFDCKKISDKCGVSKPTIASILKNGTVHRSLQEFDTVCLKQREEASKQLNIEAFLKNWYLFI